LIFNIKGQHVEEICNETLEKGSYIYTWNGKNKKDNIVGTGIYFIRLKAGNDNIIRKIACIK